MSGVKGRSGGARPGSGPKKKAVIAAAVVPPVQSVGPQLPAVPAEDPLAYLIGVMNDPSQDNALRVRAAIAAAQYTNTKRHDGGKKEELAKMAKKTGQGKFAPTGPPRLVVDNTRAG